MKTNTQFKETEIGMIPNDWEIVKFSDVAELKHGYQFRSYDFTKEGIKVFKITQIRNNGAIDISSCDFIDGNRLKEFEQVVIKKRDILMALTGATIGKIARFRDIKEPILQNYRVGNFFPINELYLSKDYLYQYLSSTFFFNQILARQTQSAQQNIGKDEINKMFIIVPKIKEQRAITKTLSDLDAKIELNQQINKTLEAIGQAIFKHWFIDCEFPNEKGKPYKSSGGEMVESELGEIPKGWRVGKLGEIGTFKNGINYLRNEQGDTEFFIANVRDIANNKLLLKEGLDKIKIVFKKAREYLLNQKDILIARSASPGDVSLVLGDLQNVIYSGFSIRYRLNNPKNYLYLFLILQELRDSLSNYSIGTTLQSVNQETLKNMMFCVPADAVLEKFNIIIEQILERTYGNMIQNSSLSQIRDSLLPKLMSGKIRVPVEVRS